jgi:hypothetical protein
MTAASEYARVESAMPPRHSGGRNTTCSCIECLPIYGSEPDADRAADLRASSSYGLRAYPNRR